MAVEKPLLIAFTFQPKWVGRRALDGDLPGAAHDVERLAGPVERVALPLGQVDLVDAAAHDDAHVAVVLREVVRRSGAAAEEMRMLLGPSDRIRGPRIKGHSDYCKF